MVRGYDADGTFHRSMQRSLGSAPTNTTRTSAGPNSVRSALGAGWTGAVDGSGGYDADG